MSILIKEMFRRKEFKYYLLLFSVFFFFFFFLNNFYLKTKEDINIKENYYTNRELAITTNDSLDTVREKTKNIEHISKLYIDNYTNGKIHNSFVKVSNFINEKQILLIKGQKIINEKQIILSKDYIDYYGKDITLTIDNDDYIMNVVGIFDDEYLENTVFILDDTNFKKPDILKYNVLIDNFKNVDATIKQLNILGYEGNIFDLSHNVYELKATTSLTIIFTVICILIILFLNILIFKNTIYDNVKENSIMKSVGFKNRDLIIINIVKNLIIIFISIIISLFICLFFFYFFNIYFYYKTIIYLFLLGIINIVINGLVFRKILSHVSTTALYNTPI